MGESDRPFRRADEFSADPTADCGHPLCDQGWIKGRATTASLPSCGPFSRMQAIDTSCCVRAGRMWALFSSSPSSWTRFIRSSCILVFTLWNCCRRQLFWLSSRMRCFVALCTRLARRRLAVTPVGGQAGNQGKRSEDQRQETKGALTCRTTGRNPPPWRSRKGDSSKTRRNRAVTARSSPRHPRATASRSSRRSSPARSRISTSMPRGSSRQWPRHPDALAVLKLHYLRWLLFDIGRTPTSCTRASSTRTSTSTPRMR